MTEAARLNYDKLLRGSVVTNVAFMGHTLAVRASSCIEHARLSVHAAVKTSAVANGQMEPLKIIDEIASLPRSEANLSFEEGVLDSYVSVYTAMEAAMDSKIFTTPEEISSFMESSKWCWLVQDPTFALEIDFIRQMAGGMGGRGDSARSEGHRRLT